MFDYKKKLEAAISAMEDELLRSKDFKRQLELHYQLMPLRAKLQKLNYEERRI